MQTEGDRPFCRRPMLMVDQKLPGRDEVAGPLKFAFWRDRFVREVAVARKHTFVQPLALIRWLLMIGGLGCMLAFGQDTPQRIPRQKFAPNGAIDGLFVNDQKFGLGNVAVTLRNLQTNDMVLVRTTGDGIFRVVNLRPGRYSIRAVLDGYQTFERNNLVVRAGELVSVQVELLATGVPARKRIPEYNPGPTYRKFPQAAGDELPLPPELTPPQYNAVPNRWKYEWPDYHRYGPKDEEPYVPQHLYDPFNRNKLKGDYPIIGNEIFLNINLEANTFVDGRRIPTPSGVSANNPGSSNFFGGFGQLVLTQNLAFDVSLFHGDAAFKPIDWQIKFDPEINVNYLKVEENGVVNIDVRKGTTRLDSHVGLQEAFVEKKIADLSHNYDFVSARLGIQTFNSDFRGFIFFDQEPGARIFGNLGDNKYQYNAAYFAMLEKDTNSGLNTLDYRKQQVFIANLYRQDFLRPGYTIQFSYHYDKDDPSLKYNTDQFLVRPQAIGTFAIHAIRSHYLGFTTDGHLGRLNVDSAFYQVLGIDTNNAVSSQYQSTAFGFTKARQTINAQMAALELSIDRDWVRYRTSFFYSSGDKRPGNGVARGFDSILDNSNFAGGFFSFWSRESIRLLGTGVGLAQGNTLIPSLRSSEIQGQASYVNPGIGVINAATDIDLTPKLRAIINQNFIRFIHPEPLDVLEFQTNIHAGVGSDSGFGLVYRPVLSDNIMLSGVFNVFVPFQGFKDIFTGTTLFAVAANVRFRF
jgi:hypothetical protein